MAPKSLIFDASTIITLSLNNLLSLLIPLKRRFKGNFLITEDVKNEIINRPLQINKFKLEALMISNMLKNRVLELSPIDVKKETDVLLEKANHTFHSDSEWIRIVHAGEASCLALANLLADKGHKVALAIDERTTRMLCENPHNLRKLLEKKLHRAVSAKEENFASFKGHDIIRSAELCFVAYKKNLISLPTEDKKAIEALLYASKFKGCAISFNEIKEAMQLV